MFATFRCFEGFSGPRLQVHHFGAYSVHCYPCYTLVLRASFDVRTEQYRAKFPLCIGLHLHSFTHICRSAPLSTKTFLTVCRLFCLKTARPGRPAPIMARPGRTARPYHPLPSGGPNHARPPRAASQHHSPASAHPSTNHACPARRPGNPPVPRRVCGGDPSAAVHCLSALTDLSVCFTPCADTSRRAGKFRSASVR